MASWVSAFFTHAIAESVMRRPTQLGKSASASLRRSACIFWTLSGSVMFFCFNFTTTMRSKIASQSAWVAWRPQARSVMQRRTIPKRTAGELARYIDAW